MSVAIGWEPFSTRAALDSVARELAIGVCDMNQASGSFDIAIICNDHSRVRFVLIAEALLSVAEDEGPMRAR